MSSYGFSGARAYATVGLETGVDANSPHGLIVMLYDGALLAISRARQAIATGDVQTRTTTITKAIQIIEEGLIVALDHRSGGELAGRLGALYRYMSSRLLVASLKNDTAALDEVARLMGELADAWRSIDPRAAARAPMAAAA